MIITELELTNFKKHKHAKFTFIPGSNMIIGPNYVGKSSLLEAILIAIAGNGATEAKAEELVCDLHPCKDFNIKLTFDTGLVIERSLKTSSITRAGAEEPFVRGHTAVNAAMMEELNIDKETFMKVFVSEQGTPQALLKMEGAQLQRFVESVKGLDTLDEVVKLANKELATAKAKMEALDPFVMAGEDFTKLTSEISRLKTERAAVTETHSSVRLKLKAGEYAYTQANVKLIEASQINEAILRYWAKVEAVKEQLAQVKHTPLLDTTGLEGELHELTEELSSLDGELKTATLVNKRIEAYNTQTASINNQLSLLTRMPLKDEQECESNYQVMSDTLSVARKAYDDRATLQYKLGNVVKQIAEHEGRLAELGNPEVKDLSELTQEVNLIGQERGGLLMKLDQLIASDKGSVCHACKRPFEDAEEHHRHTQEAIKEVTQAHALSEENYAKAYTRLQELTKEQQTAKHIQSTRAVLEGILPALREQESTLNAEIELASHHCISGESWDTLRKDVSTEYAELQARRKWNQEANLMNKQIDHLEATKASLVKPEGELTDLDALTTLLKAKESRYQRKRDDLKSLEHQNDLLRSNNLRHAELTSAAISLESNPPQGEWADLENLRQATEALRVELEANSRIYEECSSELQELQLKIQPLESQSDQHQKAFAETMKYKERGVDAGFIAMTLTNSREALVSHAMATIFNVASDFASMCTGGDMEQVLMKDGTISFKEGNKIRSRRVASGAQKSIMGLGMKLGIANLVTSNFGALLLDEVSADMNDEVSLACSMALNSMSQQNIFVSHRQLDVAGQVIELSK